MLNKIDKRLRHRIGILRFYDDNVDIIVRTKNSNASRKMLMKYALNNLVELPIINAFALSVKTNDIHEIAKDNYIEYISSNVKVNSLIFDSKRIIGVDKVRGSDDLYGGHVCVIIDTGIYPHIDFCIGKNRIIKFIDLINQSTTPYDDNGHGTFIAGILCGNSILDKYSGIDNKSNVIVIKALDKDGETSSSKILEAMQWVLDNKANFNIKVVCMSFGSELVDKNDPLIYGAEALWDNGIVVVTAAGNSGPNGETIMSPGASRRVITVGSLEVVDDIFKVADFSSRGPALGSFKPDILTPGVDIISTNIFSNNKKFYTSMSGTSVSAPMVAGVASLLFSINPNYTPNQIKYMLLKSCVSIGAGRNDEGFGRLDLSRLVLL